MRHLMVLGTASHVGKSIIATALCRIFHQDGLVVAPFKAQNMSLNSAVTPSGREIGRSQAVQAEAAGTIPNEHMNPVLLKPTGDMRTQVVIQGKVYDTVSARHFFEDEKRLLWEAVVESYTFLSNRFDLLVMEGAGSPVEMNLKERDIANLRTAEMADAAVVLVADIDRGGVFASVVGTLHLMSPAERSRVKGIIVNRFRGNPELFADGVRLLQEYTGVPVLGVIPYVRDIGIDEEDSVGLESERYFTRYKEGHQKQGHQKAADGARNIRIAVVQLPHMSNYTDFDPLFLEPGVDTFFATDPTQLDDVDVIILPGTKSTIHDLRWLTQSGWHQRIVDAARNRRFVFGICGGYQMLGLAVKDPSGQDGEGCTHHPGIGLFPQNTTMQPEKRTVLVQGQLNAPFDGIEVHGYEIHVGITRPAEGTGTPPFHRPVGHDEMLASYLPFATISEQIGSVAYSRCEGLVPRDSLESTDDVVSTDGLVTTDGRIIGTYLHGILHNDRFRNAWLNLIRADKGLAPQSSELSTDASREAAYDRIANVVRENINLRLLYEFLQH